MSGGDGVDALAVTVEGAVAGGITHLAVCPCAGGEPASAVAGRLAELLARRGRRTLLVGAAAGASGDAAVEVADDLYAVADDAAGGTVAAATRAAGPFEVTLLAARSLDAALRARAGAGPHGVVLVTSRGETPKSAVAAAAEIIEAAGARLVGVVIAA